MASAIKTGGILVTGDKKIDAVLKQFETKVGWRISEQAIGRGMTVIKKAIQKKSTQMTGSTRLKRAVGSRFVTNKRTHIREGKVGIHVGKAKRTKRQIESGRQGTHGKQVSAAKHAHLVAMGTGPRTRWRKGIGGKFSYLRGTSADPTTGAAKPIPYVIEGWNASRSQAMSKIIKTVREKIKKNAHRLGPKK